MSPAHARLADHRQSPPYRLYGAAPDELRGNAGIPTPARSIDSKSNVRRFQRHVVLLGIAPLMADDLLQQIDSLARRHRRFVLDRLIIVQLRIEPAAEN